MGVIKKARSFYLERAFLFMYEAYAFLAIFSIAYTNLSKSCRRVYT